MKQSEGISDVHAKTRLEERISDREFHRVSIPLLLHSPIHVAQGRQPISVGIPLAKGSLREPGTPVLTDAGGCGIVVQATPLARWADGSVRWLLLDFLAPELSPGVTEANLSFPRDDGANRRLPGARVDESGNVVSIDTGVARYEIGRSEGTPLNRVWLGGRVLGDAPFCRTRLVDSRGRALTPSIRNVEVETTGPVRATVCVSGRFARGKGLRFRARLSFFNGTGLVRLRLAVHNPNRARHQGGLWDLGDPESRLFEELSLIMGLPSGGAVSWRCEPGQDFTRLEGGPLEIYQDSSGGENWQSRNHVNREGRVPCRFQGYRVQAPGQESTGGRASPVVRWQDERTSLCVAVPEFWQQFPKAIEADDTSLRLGLFPRQWDDLHELQGGERKTHTVWFSFETGNEAGADPLAWADQPAVALTTPEHYAAAGAVLHLLPAAVASDERFDTLMDEALDGPKGFLAKREAIDEYGWRNFGDIWADHEDVYYEGPKPVISHYNNQFDVVDGAIRQMMRTGDPRWFELFDPLARHVMDIDIYHTRRDKAAYSGGLFWFTDHYLDAATSTHRTYTKQNMPRDGRSYGGGPGSEHNFASGLLHYHYLTGDPDAREAVFELAEWVLRMDAGAETVLGLVDDGPTGAASLKGHDGSAGPARGAANSIHVLLDAWLLGANQRYLDKAISLIRRCIHPDDDIAALRLLDAEKNWSYTMFLSAVARFLDIRADLGVLDEAYAYGRESLLHFATWMAQHERPYLDQPEELEYPTEAWAAQEFRKANVLRLAARHAETSVASEMLSRADALSERAWSDLMGFETRCAARALAVVMKEATTEAFLRYGDVMPAAIPVGQYEYGMPAKFLGQKWRVGRQLRTPTGAVRVLLSLFRPTTLNKLACLAKKRWTDC
ncbi:MAG: hypothetical protein JW818_22855 [Pirellulales bacterium]|nr:hypothetical protein [Pirellulales bacterium]